MGTVVIDSVVPYPRRLGRRQRDSFPGPQGWPAHRSAEWPLVPEPGLIWEVVPELVFLGSRPLPGVWKLGLCWRDSSMTHSVWCVFFQIKPCLGGFPEATAPVGGGRPLEPSPPGRCASTATGHGLGVLTTYVVWSRSHCRPARSQEHIRR